jgi:hypothetical protein
VVPALFSTGTRDTNRMLDMICRPPGKRFPPRAVMLHRLDEGRQIKFSELSNIEHRVRDRKIILAL